MRAALSTITVLIMIANPVSARAQNDDFVGAFMASHTGCRVFFDESPYKDPAGPFGKPLYAWTVEDVSDYMRHGEDCARQEPKNPDQQKLYVLQFDERNEHLPQDIATARAQRDAKVAADNAQIDALVNAGTAFANGQKLLAQIGSFSQSYKSLPPATALAQIKALIAQIDALVRGPDKLPDEMANALNEQSTNLAFDAADLSQAISAQSKQAQLTAICSDPVRNAGVSDADANLPLAWSSDVPNMTVGDYACLFLRLHNFNGIEHGANDELVMRIGRAALTLQRERQIQTDDFYADPQPGDDSKYAVTTIQIGDNITRITNFDDDVEFLQLLFSDLGAAPAN